MPRLLEPGARPLRALDDRPLSTLLLLVLLSFMLLTAMASMIDRHVLRPYAHPSAMADPPRVEATMRN